MTERDQNVHPRLKRHISSRLKSLESKVDFATAEAMAFGSLMKEGNDIRISGQDVGRGTFSQRHAMFVDQESEDCLIPLNESIPSSLGRLEPANSSLSEMAVLGFEVGMSWASPNLLPIWEAQFGDFMNGAQSMIDTFVIGAQAKWLKQSGLVMMLPHGYDGAGPEHSSSRFERFLQLSNDTGNVDVDGAGEINMTVANPSTPAQLFHLLRRQLHRNYRRPLIVVSPKGLLRSPMAASPLEDMGPGTKFQPVLEAPGSSSKDAKKIILCSGKHYYTIAEHLSKTSPERLGSTAIIRVEELSPFPARHLEDVFNRHPTAQVVYAQEEPQNQGAWPYLRPRLEGLLRTSGRDALIKYVGREASPAVATGIGEWYKREAAKLLSDLDDVLGNA